MKRIPRHSEVRVTGPAGETRIGRGDGLAAAVRALGKLHAAEPSPAGEARYTLTAAGVAVVCADRADAYLTDPTASAAVAMEQAYALAERRALLDEWGG